MSYNASAQNPYSNIFITSLISTKSIPEICKVIFCNVAHRIHTVISYYNFINIYKKHTRNMQSDILSCCAQNPYSNFWLLKLGSSQDGLHCPLKTKKTFIECMSSTITDGPCLQDHEIGICWWSVGSVLTFLKIWSMQKKQKTKKAKLMFHILLDSNPQPLGHESDALQLSYPAIP